MINECFEHFLRHKLLEISFLAIAITIFILFYFILSFYELVEVTKEYCAKPEYYKISHACE